MRVNAECRFILMVVCLASCSPVPPAEDVSIKVHPPVTDTVVPKQNPAVSGSRRAVIADTEETLLPNPIDRTVNRLYIARTYVQDYVRKRGRLPERLADCLPPRNQIPHPLDVDAWGNAILYTRAEGRFELTSSGPDRRFQTQDDLSIVGFKSRE